MRTKFILTLLLTTIIFACNRQASPIATSRPPTVESVSTSIPIVFPTQGSSWCHEDIELPNRKSFSPDGLWLAIICKSDHMDDLTYTKILRLDNTLSWEVPFYETFGVYQKSISPEGIKDGEMRVVHWSENGSYVYLRPYFCCTDAPEDIFFNYFLNAIAIYRLNLQTGNLTIVLSPFQEDPFAGYAVSFSTVDKYLAYVDSNAPRDIQVSTLQTGDLFRIQVDQEYIASGMIRWSPDNSKLIFVAVKEGWSDWTDSINNGVSYFMVDLNSRSLQHLFDKQEIYKPIWTQENKLILDQASGGDSLLYDFQSNSFTIITPTPHP
jgi:hypothetical protein